MVYDKEKKRQYYLKNKEHIKARVKRNREKNQEVMKLWREKNKEYIREYKKEYKKKYRQENKEKISEYGKKYYKEHKEQELLRTRNWELVNHERVKELKIKGAKVMREKYPEKMYARNMSRAIKISGLCVICKQEKAIEKHHPDYDEPMNVVFLCKQCHVKIHKNGNKI